MAESESREVVGVIGAGSFGTAIANLLAYNVNVCLYTRQDKIVERINAGKMHFMSENELTLLGWGVGGSDELSLIQRYLPDAYGIGLFGTYADSLKYINYDDATINVNVDSGITLLSAPPLPRHMDLYNKNNTSKDSASITYNIEYTNKHNDRAPSSSSCANISSETDKSKKT